MKLRRVEAEVFKALIRPLTASELESQTGLRPREIAEALERLVSLGAVESDSSTTPWGLGE